MKRTVFFFVSLLIAVNLSAQASVQRHIFEEAFDSAVKAGAFRPGGAWMPYPAYSDREGWDRISKGYGDAIIRMGEKCLKTPWEPIMATTYLEYEKTKTRSLMQVNYDHRNRLVKLVAAELVEGKGRFLPCLVDGLWMMSQMFTWSHAQHTPFQSSKRTLPVEGERPITLHSANIGATVAYALYFFKEEFDRMDPSIAITVKDALRKNVLDPYLDQSLNNWWMQKKEGKFFNNWTTYCTSHVATAFLLCEEDPERLIRALRQSVLSMDQYMNDVRSDGACDEGPSYWDMAAGRVYDYARLMCDASSGKMNLLGDPLIRRMGEFKSKTYFGDGYVMNFADGRCRDVGDLALFFRYGTDTGSEELVNFAVSQLASPEKKAFRMPNIKITYMSRVLETMRYGERLRETQDKLLAGCGGNWRKLKYGMRGDVGSIWYDQTQYAVMREGSWILAAKAGNNGESHNHNDVGSGILFVNSRPVLVDPGVGTYVKETFGENRYTVWCNQSDWHNAPVINGCPQIAGREYAASNVSCDTGKGVFAADIAGAYPEESSCDRWMRTWKLSDGELVLTDEYELSERKAPDVVNFIVRGDVYLPGDTAPGGYVVQDGEVVLTAYSFSRKASVDLLMTYPEGMTPIVTVKDLTSDRKMQEAWGDSLRRISFTSKANSSVKGRYEFRVKNKE